MRIKIEINGEMSDEDKPKVEASIKNIKSVLKTFSITKTYKEVQGAE